MHHARKVTGAVALTFAALTMTGGLAGVAGAARAAPVMRNSRRFMAFLPLPGRPIGPPPITYKL